MMALLEVEVRERPETIKPARTTMVSRVEERGDQQAECRRQDEHIRLCAAHKAQKPRIGLPRRPERA